MYMYLIVSYQFSDDIPCLFNVLSVMSWAGYPSTILELYNELREKVYAVIN